jgi:hypothetical protein
MPPTKFSGPVSGTPRAYLTPNLWQGVWVSDRPLDINEGADGDTYLVLEIPESAVAEYEWVEVKKPYREFLLPADMLNEYGPPQVVSDEVASDEKCRGAADPEGD